MRFGQIAWQLILSSFNIAFRAACSTPSEWPGSVITRDSVTAPTIMHMRETARSREPSSPTTLAMLSKYFSRCLLRRNAHGAIVTPMHDERLHGNLGQKRLHVSALVSAAVASTFPSRCGDRAAKKASPDAGQASGLELRERDVHR